MNNRIENILRNKAELLNKEKQLNIRPKMEIAHRGKGITGAFDLRSLNKEIVKNEKVDQ